MEGAIAQMDFPILMCNIQGQEVSVLKFHCSFSHDAVKLLRGLADQRARMSVPYTYGLILRVTQ